TPVETFEDQRRYRPTRSRLCCPRGERQLLVQQVGPVLWYAGCEGRPVKVVLVRDPGGKWPDVALLSTAARLRAAEGRHGYARRWSIEVTFHDNKQHLGLHDPQVWTERSVQRAPFRGFRGRQRTAAIRRITRNARFATALPRSCPLISPKR